MPECSLHKSILDLINGVPLGGDELYLDGVGGEVAADVLLVHGRLLTKLYYLGYYSNESTGIQSNGSDARRSDAQRLVCIAAHYLAYIEQSSIQV